MSDSTIFVNSSVIICLNGNDTFIWSSLNITVVLISVNIALSSIAFIVVSRRGISHRFSYNPWKRYRMICGVIVSIGVCFSIICVISHWTCFVDCWVIVVIRIVRTDISVWVVTCLIGSVLDRSCVSNRAWVSNFRCVTNWRIYANRWDISHRRNISNGGNISNLRNTSRRRAFSNICCGHWLFNNSFSYVVVRYIFHWFVVLKDTLR